ncbi:MAG: hypothetical protein KDG89_01760 [Geminicoccaceae bacterium]|nr:hypothetical protein [Geminicoccaceae bacterium]
MRKTMLCGLVAAALGGAALDAAPAQAASQATFPMSRSNGLGATCAAKAVAVVKVQSLGFAEKMTVAVAGLRAGTELDLFALQVPDFPFGVAWYVGDLEVGSNGRVTKTFIGRFNIETFAVAVGVPAPAPHTHAGDANSNPTFAPVHTYHLGMWFNSPADAALNGCPNVLTPFNGEHDAGIQVLSTRIFPKKNGPLKKIN